MDHFSSKLLLFGRIIFSSTPTNLIQLSTSFLHNRQCLDKSEKCVFTKVLLCSKPFSCSWMPNYCNCGMIVSNFQNKNSYDTCTCQLQVFLQNIIAFGLQVALQDDSKFKWPNITMTFWYSQKVNSISQSAWLSVTVCIFLCRSGFKVC